MITLPESNFCFDAWEQMLDDTLYVVPHLNSFMSTQNCSPPDRYRPGGTAWGKDPKRGQAIMRARSKKRLDVNRALFLLDVLPRIEPHLNANAWKDLARDFPEHATSYLSRGGWTRYTATDGRTTLIHVSDTDKIKQALDLGAKPL